MDKSNIIPYLRAFSTLTRKEQDTYIVLLAVLENAQAMTASRLADTLDISTRALSRLKKKLRGSQVLHKTLPL